MDFTKQIKEANESITGEIYRYSNGVRRRYDTAHG